MEVKRFTAFCNLLIAYLGLRHICCPACLLAFNLEEASLFRSSLKLWPKQTIKLKNFYNLKHSSNKNTTLQSSIILKTINLKHKLYFGNTLHNIVSNRSTSQHLSFNKGFNDRPTSDHVKSADGIGRVGTGYIRCGKI